MMLKNLFPSYKLSPWDYFFGGLFLALCFASFFHSDIYITGRDSINFLFGSPLEFYENCKKVRGSILATPYPPSVYAVFALWLYPFKLLGVLANPNHFPIHLAYWLKALTTLVYAASGVVFYKIMRVYSDDKDWGKYATAIWLTTPLAVFSQFIFSQYDIFYVFLTLAAFLMFLRGHLSTGSLFFGIAITFKYFPAFAFIPLLLLFEKRIPKLLIHLFAFLAPTLLVQYLYGQSPAFIEGVNNHHAILRIYEASLDVGLWKIMYLFAFFTILCSATYLSEIAKERLPRVAAYVYLLASTLPFLFIYWHPQWIMFFAPAAVLTTMIDKRCEKFLALDLLGMFCFVAALSLFFNSNVDTPIFRGDLLGLPLKHSHLMFKLFTLGNAHTTAAFFSVFWGYLAVQIILKFKPALQEGPAPEVRSVNYKNVRYRLYIGMLIFIVPAFLALCKDYANTNRFIANEFRVHKSSSKDFGELIKDRSFEQSFVAGTGPLEQIDLLLATFARENSGSLFLEIIDSHGQTIDKIETSVESLKDTAWQRFKLAPFSLTRGETYRIRLTSPMGQKGNAITWLASLNNSYPKGNAIIDGVPQNTDFGFRIKFLKSKKNRG